MDDTLMPCCFSWNSLSRLETSFSCKSNSRFFSPTAILFCIAAWACLLMSSFCCSTSCGRSQTGFRTPRRLTFLAASSPAILAGKSSVISCCSVSRAYLVVLMVSSIASSCLCYRSQFELKKTNQRRVL